MTLPRRWSTDSTFSSGIDISTPTRVDPGAAIAAQGFIPHEGVEAQYLNNLFGEITDYLHDGASEHFEIREDFAGAVADMGASRLDASFPWRTNDSFSPAINHRSGTAKNPGQLECAIPTDAGGCHYEFHIGSNTGTPLSYAAFEFLEVVVKIQEDPANVSETIRFGLVDDASAENGGSDCLCVYRSRTTNATKWLLLKRVGGSSSITPLTSADFTDGEFAVWRLEKRAAGGIDFYLDGALVHTVASGALPSGNATLSFWQSTGAADTELLTVTWDLIRLRSLTGDRSGA